MRRFLSLTLSLCFMFIFSLSVSAAEKAVSSVGEFYNLKMQGEGTAENL